MRYFDGPAAGKLKFFETLSIFEVGKTPIRKGISWTKNGEISEVVQGGSANPRDRWTKVEFKATPGVSSNKAGFRLTSLSRATGVYPPHLISNADAQPSYPRCYYTAYTDDKCLAIALLASELEAQSLEYRRLDKLYKVGPGAVNDRCRVAYSDQKCVVTKAGFIRNVSPEQISPFSDGMFTQEELDGFEQNLKKTIRIFQSNTGKSYIAPCPVSCKTIDFSIFLFISNIFRWRVQC